MATMVQPLFQTLQFSKNPIPTISKPKPLTSPFLSTPSKPTKLYPSLSLKTHHFSSSSFISHVVLSSFQGEEQQQWEANTAVDETGEEEEVKWGGGGDDDGFRKQDGGGLSNWGEDVGEEGEGDDGGYVAPPEEAKLFVGNLSFDVDSQKLAQIFEPAGVVEVAEVIYNRQVDQSRGFGFVTMSTVEEADKAVELFHKYELDGRVLVVNKASPRGERVERTPWTSVSSFRIYVGNLPWDLDSPELRQVFSQHGTVLDAGVVYDRETGRSRGFGFVGMASESERDAAIAAVDGQTVAGRVIRARVAEDRPRRSS